VGCALFVTSCVLAVLMQLRASPFTHSSSACEILHGGWPQRPRIGEGAHRVFEVRQNAPPPRPTPSATAPAVPRDARYSPVECRFPTAAQRLHSWSYLHSWGRTTAAGAVLWEQVSCHLSVGAMALDKTSIVPFVVHVGGEYPYTCNRGLSGTVYLCLARVQAPSVASPHAPPGPLLTPSRPLPLQSSRW